MIRFGPATFDDLFKEEGNENSAQMPKWLKKKFGLSAYEHSFSLGFNLSDEAAEMLGAEAKKYDVQISAHAPYYINFGNPDESYEKKSINYILTSLKKLQLMGGKRLVVHVGSQSKQLREEVLQRIELRLKNLSKELDEYGFQDIMVCFETLGRYSSIGTYQELAPLTNIDRRFSLTLDFGHINCLMQGGLKTEADYQKIFDDLAKIMPPEKIKNIHIHFSKIEFNAKGETKHTTFANEQYGPSFEPMLKVLIKNKITPTIICESKGTQARDIFVLKESYQKLVKTR